MTATAGGRFETIQYLRFVAAALVVLFHEKRFLPDDDILQAVIKEGRVGVDIFFVISGFVIAGVAARAPRPLDFALARIARIFPLYALATVAMLVMRFALPDMTTLKSLLFLPQANADAPSYGYPTLLVGWTLNYEMAFYAVMCVAIALTKRPVLWTAAFFLATSAITFLWGSEHSLSAYQEPVLPFAWLSMVANPLVLQFVLGIALFHISPRLPQMDGVGAVIAVLLLIATLSLALLSPWTAGNGLAGAGMFATPIVAIALLVEKAARNRPLRGLRFLGDASYALYLVHVPVIAVAARILPGTGWTEMVLVFLLAIAGGCLVHAYVEKPIAKALRPLVARPMPAKPAREIDQVSQ